MKNKTYFSTLPLKIDHFRDSDDLNYTYVCNKKMLNLPNDKSGLKFNAKLPIDD